MALIIRIDVDRPYGRVPINRHIFSRVSSDFYFPRVQAFGYLSELTTMLKWLTDAGASAYVFFRRCTFPTKYIAQLIRMGRHEAGLHLENSRSFATFLDEKNLLEDHVGQAIRAISKHGSGGAKFGWHHYAPYEPEKYIEWACQASMRLFLGNLEDPSLERISSNPTLTVFPSAFWLEPSWRDTTRFPVAWLYEHARYRDVVLLVHPENVLADAGLTSTFRDLIRTLPSRILD
ncbi:MAG TPA: hypothetical protein VEX68_08855 [Bryobacteraceae bacterium]|nr:hypothetical protein [Bryobacteraceae bacterium]